MLSIVELKTEYRENPIGIDSTNPRFFWILNSDKQNTVQESFHLLVTSSEGTMWDTGNVQSKKSIHVEYEGETLKPCTRYQVKLEVTDNHGECASIETWFETGLLSYENMKANWITHGYEDNIEPCPVFYKDFSLSKEVKCARVYASALGVYEILLNGEKVGDICLAPGWTSYQARVQYQTYDITDMLKVKNHIDITVGNGWFSGTLGWENTPNHYGTRTAALVQLQVEYTDGTKETIVTDTSWKYTTGSRRYGELYDGEVIDYTYTQDQSAYASIFEYPKSVLIAQECDPVRIIQQIKAIKRIITPKGEVLLDFGQNLTGVVQAKVMYPRGTKIILQHAEVLDKEGNFYTENLREAKATDTFICSGCDDVFLPAFTFHGFRYLKVEGLGEAFDLNCFTACVMHTDMEITGEFTCSHNGINQLQSNILWSQRDNFLDIPTDCPQRNERLGWTGDAQVFAATAAYNMNVPQFFAKWLRDLKQDQTLEHGVPHIVPDILKNTEGAAAWGDAATVIPWTMYVTYGDKRILADQYDSMKCWVKYIRSKTGKNNLWQSGFQYGDWLGLDKEEGSDRVGATDVYLIASAYYAYSTSLVVRAAKVLGFDEDVKEYEKLYNDILNSFQMEYITRTGRMVSETQTGCIFALYFNLAPKEDRSRILTALVENLARHNNHLVTGFVGTPYLCLTLSENGCHGIAGEVFLKQDYPSWLYEVGMGATTIWERWNSMREDGSIESNGMNSFNHYAYGSIGEWMYKKLAGLQIVEPGYEKIHIAPMPIKGITWVDASVKTMYGKLACKWNYENNNYTVHVTIPVNTTATLALPGKKELKQLGSGSYCFEYEVN